eukprot:CAMPEP_0172485548 /NCGR_PEP_ID=MMETSP1066-20121228/13617_1 /TAXON_ID=671091 /ORGANISM="Coscinodiscus wailesii, Strain CCMP2513" /LENGTH=90 /DNA_ID=CAMNT_0013250871 /DNA_START=32 /DNA_END=304 /DNA_ORIENTATION=-
MALFTFDLNSFHDASSLVAAAWWCRAVVFGAGTGLGFLMTVLIPIGFEYGTAILYAADEAAVTDVLECAAEFGGFIMITLVVRSRRSESC